MRSRDEATADAKRLRRGIARREAAGDLVDRAEGVVVDQDVARVGAGSARAIRGSSVALVRARERDVRVRERPELEVVVCVGALLEVAQHVLERLGPVEVAQPEGGDAAQGHRGDHAERAE